MGFSRQEHWSGLPRKVDYSWKMKQIYYKYCIQFYCYSIMTKIWRYLTLLILFFKTGTFKVCYIINFYSDSVIKHLFTLTKSGLKFNSIILNILTNLEDNNECVITTLAIKLITLCRIGSFCVQTLNISYSIVYKHLVQERRKEGRNGRKCYSWNWNQMRLCCSLLKSQCSSLLKNQCFREKEWWRKKDTLFFPTEGNTVGRWQTSFSNTISELPIRGQLRLPRCNIAIWWSSSDDQE